MQFSCTCFLHISDEGSARAADRGGIGIVQFDRVGLDEPPPVLLKLSEDVFLNALISLLRNI